MLWKKINWVDTILGPGIIPFTLVVQCCSGGIKSHYNMHFWVVISHIQWFMVSTINWTQWIKHIRHNSFLWIFRGMDTLAGKVPFSNLLEVIYSKKEKSLHPGRVNSFFLEFSFQKLGLHVQESKQEVKTCFGFCKHGGNINHVYLFSLKDDEGW